MNNENTTTSQVIAAFAAVLVNIAAQSEVRMSTSFYNKRDANDSCFADATFYTDGSNFSISLYQFNSVQKNTELIQMIKFCTESKENIAGLTALDYPKKEEEIKRRMEAANV